MTEKNYEIIVRALAVVDDKNKTNISKIFLDSREKLDIKAQSNKKAAAETSRRKRTGFTVARIEAAYESLTRQVLPSFYENDPIFSKLTNPDKISISNISHITGLLKVEGEKKQRDPVSPLTIKKFILKTKKQWQDGDKDYSINCKKLLDLYEVYREDQIDPNGKNAQGNKSEMKVEWYKLKKVKSA